jgi:hypothetical protein
MILPPLVFLVGSSICFEMSCLMRHLHWQSIFFLMTGAVTVLYRFYSNRGLNGLGCLGRRNINRKYCKCHLGQDHSPYNRIFDCQNRATFAKETLIMRNFFNKLNSIVLSNIWESLPNRYGWPPCTN